MGTCFSTGFSTDQEFTEPLSAKRLFGRFSGKKSDLEKCENQPGAVTSAHTRATMETFTTDDLFILVNVEIYTMNDRKTAGQVIQSYDDAGKSGFIRRSEIREIQCRVPS